MSSRVVGSSFLVCLCMGTLAVVGAAMAQRPEVEEYRTAQVPIPQPPPAPAPGREVNVEAEIEPAPEEPEPPAQADEPPAQEPPAQAAPPPSPEPAPESPPVVERPAEAPVLKFTVPESVEVGDFVEAQVEHISGGGIRETFVWIDHKQVWPAGRIKNFRMDDDERGFHFAAPPGYHVIRVVCVGRDRGWFEEEVRVLVKGPATSSKAKAAVPASPAEILARDIRGWRDNVNSANKRAEAVEVSKAALITAQRLRARQIDPGQAAEQWQVDAYRRMATAFGPWNQTPTGRSFFQNVTDLVHDNAKLPNADPATLLESIADILVK